MFCGCRICENARRLGGHDIRNRSMAVLNHELCIDLPCDARSSFLEYRHDARKIRYVIVTHNHYDHFMAENLLTRPEGFRPVELFVSRESGRELAEKCEKLRASQGEKSMRPVICPAVHFVEPFCPVEFAGYSIFPLPANHAPQLGALNYAITTQGKAILWLHDTGFPFEKTLRALENLKIYFDLVSMDCSLETGTLPGKDHMDILQCARTAEKLRSMKCADDNTVFCLSHIGHLVNRTHEELQQEANKFGFQVAYDGMEINL